MTRIKVLLDVYVRIKEGQVHTGDVIRMMATGATFTVVECGYICVQEAEQNLLMYYRQAKDGYQNHTANGIQRHLSCRWCPIILI